MSITSQSVVRKKPPDNIASDQNFCEKSGERCDAVRVVRITSRGRSLYPETKIYTKAAITYANVEPFK